MSHVRFLARHVSLPIVLFALPLVACSGTVTMEPDADSASGGTATATGGTSAGGDSGSPVGQPVGTGGLIDPGGALNTGGRVYGVGGSVAGSTGSSLGWEIPVGRDPNPNDPAYFGFAFASRNRFGINGPAYTYHDEGGSQIAGSVPQNGRVCVKGNTARVDLNCGAGADCWSKYWGAGVALNLNQARDHAPDAPSDPQPFDLSAAGIDGFTFDLTGPDVPDVVRFSVRAADGPYCVDVAPGHHQVFLSELSRNCWAPEASTLDASTAWALSWDVPTNPGAPDSFDYCVDNLQVLQNPILL